MTSSAIRPLYGHTSETTAYVIEDYLYGRRLRTTKYIWIEHVAGKGFRTWYRTANPKTGRTNKPKASTYNLIGALYLDADEHVQTYGLNAWSESATIDEFESRFPEHAQDFEYAEAIRLLRAMNRAGEHLTYEVHTCEPGCDKPHQTIDDQAEIVDRVIKHELWQDSRGAWRSPR